MQPLSLDCRLATVFRVMLTELLKLTFSDDREYSSLFNCQVLSELFSRFLINHLSLITVELNIIFRFLNCLSLSSKA
jgi:predicted membrane protein